MKYRTTRDFDSTWLICFCLTKSAVNELKLCLQMAMSQGHPVVETLPHQALLADTPGMRKKI